VLQQGANRARGALGAQCDGAPTFIVKRVHLFLNHIGGFADRTLKQLRMLKNRGADFAIAYSDASSRITCSTSCQRAVCSGRRSCVPLGP
jgi:hypothetical protein